MTTLCNCLYERSLELAAGVKVNCEAYEAAHTASGLNLAKLQLLGKAFRQGWLHNVLARITPLTARETTDYSLMAELFITERAQAEVLMSKLSADLSRFATAAGVMVTGNVVPMPLLQHVNLYQTIGATMAERFGMATPAPFASATIDAATQAEMPFIRKYMRERFAA